MVNLQALEAAVAKVERIRDHEFSFEVDGTVICMVPLRPDQETEVQKYAQVAMESVRDGEANQAAFADFMDRMRHASLGCSIIQIGQLDLREVEYIETGETDARGNPISLTKWEAICNLIARDWSRLMLSQVFGKFGEMLDRLELRAQKSVSFEPVDLEEEIERTSRRLTELREARDRIKPPDQEPMQQQQQNIAQMDKAAQDMRNDIRNRSGKASTPDVVETMEDMENEPPPVSSPPPQATPPQARQPAQGRTSAIPQNAPPRERTPERDNSEDAQEVREQYLDERGIVLPDGGDSFFDPADPGQAMEIESRRQAALHNQALNRQRMRAEEAERRREMGIPSSEELAQQMTDRNRQASRPKAVDLSQPGPVVEGLRQAANLHNAVLDGKAGSIRAGRPQQPQPQSAGAGKPAELHGKPVFKMPTQTLDRPEGSRQHGEAAPGPAQINPPGGTRNPHFRGPGRGS